MPTNSLRIVNDSTKPTRRDRIVAGAVVLLVFAAVPFLGYQGWRSFQHRDDPRPEWVASVKSLTAEARAVPVTEANKVFVQSVAAKHYAEIDCRSIVTTSTGGVDEVSDAWFRRLLARGWTLTLPYNQETAATAAIQALDPKAPQRAQRDLSYILVDARSYEQRPADVRAAALVVGGGRWELRDELEASLAFAGPGPYSFRGCESGHPVRSHTTRAGETLVEFNMRGVYAR